MLGGGYVLSFVNQNSLRWNESLMQYEEIRVPIRHNWLISVGPSVSWNLPAILWGRSVALFLDYRLQVQGIFINNTAPVIAYAPLRLGISLPISNIQTKE